MDAMSVPDKYKQLGEFYKYFIGEKTAPILTIFIGGNHEASNYLRELFYGGFAAPNIYFLGSTGVLDLVLEVDGKEQESIYLAGISGIEQYHDFKKGYFEKFPFQSHFEVKSIYHYR